MRYPKAFEKLVTHFMRFPGTGRKTAERFVFDMLMRWDVHALEGLSQAIKDLSNSIALCDRCQTHIESIPCPLCTEKRISQQVLCVVSSSKDVYSLEATNLFQGTYFVIGSLISPLDGRGLQDACLEKLKKRLKEESVQEIILAFDSSVEGDATASFLRDELLPFSISISKLASGVPVGAPLEFVDRGTLSRALMGRQQM